MIGNKPRVPVGDRDQRLVELSGETESTRLYFRMAVGYCFMCRRKHQGLHNTTHMKRAQEADVQGRKQTPGESEGQRKYGLEEMWVLGCGNHEDILMGKKWIQKAAQTCPPWSGGLCHGISWAVGCLVSLIHKAVTSVLGHTPHTFICYFHEATVDYIVWTPVWGSAGPVSLGLPSSISWQASASQSLFQWICVVMGEGGFPWFIELLLRKKKVSHFLVNIFFGGPSPFFSFSRVSLCSSQSSSNVARPGRLNTSELLSCISLKNTQGFS